MVQVPLGSSRRLRLRPVLKKCSVGKVTVEEAKVNKVNINKANADDASFDEPNFGKALAEVTTLEGIISSEYKELVDSINKIIRRSEKERSEYLNKDVRERAYKCLVLEDMTGTLGVMMDYLTELREVPECKWPEHPAWRYFSEKEPANIVQCSYDHFTGLRNIMWPNGIKDFYTTASLEVCSTISEEDVSIFCTGLRKDVLESGEYPRQSTKAISQSAELQSCKSTLAIRENLVTESSIGRRGFRRRPVLRSPPAA